MGTVSFPHRSAPARDAKDPTDVMLLDDTNNDKLLLEDGPNTDELQLQDA